MSLCEVTYYAATQPTNLAVKNQWNGMVEWNTGMEYWNDFNNKCLTNTMHPLLSKYKCYTMHQLNASDLFHPIAS